MSSIVTPTKLPRTVVLLGLVSFFNDLASDMVIPLIPILLASVLAVGPMALGVIEGFADAVASFLKLWSGRHSDYLGGRRKGLTLAGYALSNLTRPLLGLAGSWPMVLFLRSVDRVGKGIRSAPRDALVADATPASILGRAFGFHRMLDNGGAVGGALLAAAVLSLTQFSLTQIILLSAVPGALALLLVLAIDEPPRKAAARQPLPPLVWSTIPPTVRRYLGVLALFTFAKASETFIVLRGYEMGLGIVHLLVLWAALNFCKAVASSVGGHAADKIGRVRVMLMSWVGFGITFAWLGQVSGAGPLWWATLTYGFAAGLSEGAERALIADLAPVESRGTAFGWYYLVLGFAAIPAGVIFGGLWQWAGATVAFSAAAAAAIGSALLLSRLILPAVIRPLP
ncbi:MAG: MFS transporter [Burkholderiales bacterium]|nr:MFS transporter [Burkholderiales bacterium]